MRVVVYVEGPSDKYAMEALLRPLIETKEQEGVRITFVQAPPGDAKASVLTRVPKRAVNILLNDPEAIVVAMPDLYPKDKAFPHETATELVAGIRCNFRQALAAKGGAQDPRLEARFKAFCFKHDLEALILAAGPALDTRLGLSALPKQWRVPVENQDHDNPPKFIVRRLFNECGKRYVETVDARVILGMCRYQDIAAKCPQCFGPFVDFLSGLTPAPQLTSTSSLSA